MKPLFLILFPLLILLNPLPSWAQDEKAPEYAAALDHSLPLADLEILLAPLTQESLESAAKAMMEEVQKAGMALAQARIAVQHAEGQAREELAAKVETLIQERDDRVKRLEAAIAALSKKGGDVELFDKYLSVASGNVLEETTEGDTLSKAGTLSKKALDWLQSEEGGIKWGLNIIFFFATLIAFWLLAAVLGGITRKSVTKVRKASELLKDFFANSVRKTTFFIGLVVALSFLGVDIGPFLAAIGVLGFVVGFALQGTLSNFASGIMILLYRPYDIGDVVSVSGVTGKVDSMSLVSTTVVTPDNQIVVVPNNSIWGGIITNITGSSTRRVDMTFGIGYSDDIPKAQAILEKILADHPLVMKDPAPVVKLHELADSSVNFVVRPWTKTSDYWAVYWDITRAVKERFDAEGVSIPFPQRDVHIHQSALAAT